MYRPLLVSLAIAIIAVPRTGCASEIDGLPLEALLDVEVSSPSRFPQASRDAPAMVTVVTREQIRDHGWTTLADLLDAVPGLFVATDRSYRYLGVRGFLQPADYNTKVLLLVDGIPVNDGLYEQAYLGSEFILDMSMVDHVEFVPGPGSSVYGSNAILGVINVVTASARKLAGPRVALSAGSHEMRGGLVSYGAADAGHELLVAAGAMRSKGEDVFLPPAGDTAFGRADGVDGERAKRALLKYDWSEFSLLGLYSDRRKGYPTAGWGTTFGDRRAAFRDRMLLLALSREGEVAPGINLLTRVSLGASEFFGDYPYDDEAPPTLNRDEGFSRWWGAEIQGTDVRFDRHTLIYGLEYRHDYRLAQKNFDAAPRVDYLDDRRDTSHVGLYAQDEWHVDTWRINAGLRVDHYGTFGTAVSPRVALIQRLDRATTVKYLFGSAFRAPNAYELYYHDGPTTMKANPDLRPERVRTFELGLEHATGNGWMLSGSLFRNRIRDLIAQEADPADGNLLVYRNQGRVTVNGMVLAARHEWDGGTRLAASTSWQQVSHDEAFGRPVGMPRLIAKLDLTVPLAGGWRATVEERYLGRRLTRGGDTGATAFSNLALVDTPPWLRGGQVSLRVDNLFDRRMVDPASDEYAHETLPREGRIVRATLTWPL